MDLRLLLKDKREITIRKVSMVGGAHENKLRSDVRNNRIDFSICPFILKGNLYVVR